MGHPTILEVEVTQFLILNFTTTTTLSTTQRKLRKSSAVKTKARQEEITILPLSRPQIGPQAQDPSLRQARTRPGQSLLITIVNAVHSAHSQRELRRNR